MLSFKTELKLNNKQRSLMASHAGCARFAYNWGLALSDILPTLTEAVQRGTSQPHGERFRSFIGRI
jgi:hypothetical protein